MKGMMSPTFWIIFHLVSEGREAGRAVGDSD